MVPGQYSCVPAMAETDDRGILSTHLHAQGTLGDILYVDGAVGHADRPGTLVMNGREVFRHAVLRLAEAVDEALAANGLNRRTWIGWCRTRPICGSSMRWDSASGCRRAGGGDGRPACQHFGRFCASCAG